MVLLGVLLLARSITGCCDLRNKAVQLVRRNRNTLGGGNQRIFARRIDNHDLRAMLCRLAQPLGKQRVILAQYRADNKHAIERVQFGNGHAQPRGALQRVFKAGVGLTQAKIDMLRTQATREPRQQGQLLDGGVFCGKRADLAIAMCLVDALEHLRCGSQCLVPGRFAPYAIITLDHRCFQAIINVQSFV